MHFLSNFFKLEKERNVSVLRRLQEKKAKKMKMRTKDLDLG